MIGGRKLNKKFIKPISISLIILVAASLGYWGYKKFATSKTSATTARYTTVTASKMNLEVTVQGTGAVFAASTATITATNSGVIKNLNAKVGDTVSSITTLCTLTNDQLQQALAKAKTDLESANLQLANSKDAQETASNTLKVTSAQQSVTAAQAQISTLTIKSPISGMVVSKTGSTGASVQSGAELLTVSDLNSLKVKVAVDELDISKIKIGQTAKIKLDALTDITFSGTVDDIAQIGTNSNNVTTYDVTVSIANPKGIKIGMNANVTIAVESKADALVIPAEALVEKGGTKYVMVDNSSTTSTNANRIKTAAGNLVAIKTGIQNENYIEVTSGVTEGEKLMVTLPQTTTTTTNARSGFSGFGGMTGGYVNPNRTKSTGTTTQNSSKSTSTAPQGN